VTASPSGHRSAFDVWFDAATWGRVQPALESLAWPYRPGPGLPDLPHLALAPHGLPTPALPPTGDMAPRFSGLSSSTVAEAVGTPLPTRAVVPGCEPGDLHAQVRRTPATQAGWYDVDRQITWTTVAVWLAEPLVVTEPESDGVVVHLLSPDGRLRSVPAPGLHPARLRDLVPGLLGTLRQGRLDQIALTSSCR